MNRLQTKTVTCGVTTVGLKPVVSTNGNVVLNNILLDSSGLFSNNGGFRILNVTMVSTCPPCVSAEDGSHDAFWVTFYDNDTPQGLNNYTVKVPALNMMASCDLPIYSSSAVTSLKVEVGGDGFLVGSTDSGTYNFYLHVTIEVSK